MKKILIAVALMGLVATSVEAQARGYYHGGYRHGGYHSGSAFFFGAALGAALTFPFYYSYARDPGPYYYSPYYAPGPTVYMNPPVYVQSQPVYVQSQPNYAVAAAQPRNVVTQAPNNGVIELGPANAQPPVNANPAPGPESGQTPADQWFVYPSRGQSQQQAANDRYDCGKWATGQSGYDPDLRVHRNPETGYVNYGRALSACLEGRGYTVR
jgi:hypothetical protein